MLKTARHFSVEVLDLPECLQLHRKGRTMNYFKGLLAVILVTLSFALAQTETYTSADPAHNFVYYKVDYANFGREFGRFNTLDYTFVLDRADATKSSIEFTVDATSLDTGVDKRNSDITGPDFLNAAEFPSITFKSTSVTDAGDGNLEVTGDLTVRGTTKPITALVEKIGEGEGGQGEYRVGYYTEFVFNRQDYGIDWLPGVIGDEITLMISVSGIRQ
jgi:polyisoprenoid-binding protein YceI